MQQAFAAFHILCTKQNGKVNIYQGPPKAPEHKYMHTPHQNVHMNNTQKKSFPGLITYDYTVQYPDNNQYILHKAAKKSTRDSFGITCLPRQLLCKLIFQEVNFQQLMVG